MDVASDTSADAPDGALDLAGDAALTGPSPLLDFTRQAGFYSTPFPDDARRVAGAVDLTGFPNPGDIRFVHRLLALLDGVADGFAVSAGVFFALDAPIDIPEVSPADTLLETAPVGLISVDSAAPDFGERTPVRLGFSADGGPFGAPNLLSLVPVQGFLLRERTTYAAVLMRDLPGGEPLRPAAALDQLLAGERPTGLSPDAFATYRSAIEALEALGLPLGELAGLTVFTTGSPTAELLAARDQVTSAPLPVPTAAPALAEVFEGYCVYETTIAMPSFQSGQPPFATGGGGWSFEEGVLVPRGEEEANLVLTIPRRPEPPAGYPTVVFVRTGGGGERPLVDRGRRTQAGGPPERPGEGPAHHLAAAGFAGLSIDGPHGGLRNVTGGDEQFLMFNVTNPLALRDNVRQAALETALAAHLIDHLRVDASECPGAGGEVGLDGDRIGLMGHSMGATVMVPAAAAEPRFGALVLSGAGGSYIENVLHKLSPVPVRPIAETLLQYTGTGRVLTAHDPILSLLQWAGEPADPPVYGHLVVSEPRSGAAPRDVLMLQGVVDTYLFPPMANAVSLSLGLDLAGDALDGSHPELAHFTPLSELLALTGGQHVPLPAGPNREIAHAEGVADVSAIVVQHLEDGIEDGHEVVFQTSAPKRQYRCFFESFAAGRSRVVGPDDPDAPCP